MAEFSAGSVAVFFKAQTDEFVKGVDETNKKLEGFKQAVTALGAYEAFNRMTDAVRQTIEAASEAELNVRKLSAVVSSQQDVAGFAELASQLSHVTTYSDDAAMSALTLLGNYDLTDQQMASMLPKVADFAAAMGHDLPQAAAIAGKAIANGAVALRGLGLSFTDAEKKAFDLSSQSERVAILMDKMNGKFHGVAEAAAQTGAGAMKQYHNALGEVDEALGRLIGAPVAVFFGGMTDVVNMVSGAIDNMSEGTRTALGWVTGIIGTLAAMTTATLAVGSAVAFFGGLPVILGAVATAASTVAATIGTILLPLTLIVGSVVTLAAMRSRIQAGTFNTSEGVIDSIKNNFKAGLADIKGGFKELFEAPKADVKSMAEAVKGFDNTLRKTTENLHTLDFGGASAGQTGLGDSMGNLENTLGIDFAKFVDENGAELTGSALAAAKDSDAANAKGVGQEYAATQGGRDREISGMSAAEVAAKAAELGNSISLTDKAVAGVKGGAELLVGRMGSVGATMANAANATAAGGPIAGIASLVVDMLTRTKSFGRVVGTIEQIFTELSQVFEPVMATVAPLLEVVGLITPVLVKLNAGFFLLQPAIALLEKGVRWVVTVVPNAWNTLIDSVAKFVANVPGIGDWLRDSVASLKLKTLAETPKPDPPPEPPPDPVVPAARSLAGALDTTTESVKELNKQMVNVPEGFKLAATRFAAISTVADAEVPAMVRLARGTAAPGVPGGGGAGGIHIANLNVTSNKPDDVVSAITEAAQRDAFVRTGRRPMNPSTRQFWGG